MSAPKASDVASEFWRFAGLSGPLVLRSEIALETQRQRFLATWPMTRTGQVADTDIELVATAGGWRLLAPQLAPSETGNIAHETEHAAVQALSGVLAACAVRQDAALIGLHCSAVELAGGLFLLPGASHSGKSTLAVQLAARGARLFGDDRLALRFGAGGIEGVALGLTPKLRLPLPAQAGPRYRAFIEARLLLTAVDVAYILPRDDEIAPFGAALPVRGLVLPRRQGGVRARMEEMPRDVIVRSLLDTAYAPHVAPPVLLARLDALSRLPARALPFESSAEAADALEGWASEIGPGGARG